MITSCPGRECAFNFGSLQKVWPGGWLWFPWEQKWGSCRSEGVFDPSGRCFCSSNEVKRTIEECSDLRGGASLRPDLRDLPLSPEQRAQAWRMDEEEKVAGISALALSLIFSALKYKCECNEFWTLTVLFQNKERANILVIPSSPGGVR